MAAPHFFISYTGADVAWAEWVAQTLEDAGYQTVLQAWDFRPGDNFIQRMDQALAEADRVVAVLSPAYFASEYTRDEWTAALIRARGEDDRLLPVRIEAVELPPLLANRVYLDLVDLEEQAAAERLLAGVQPGRAKPEGRRRFPGGQARPGGVSFPGRRPAIFGVPARKPHFMGRGELLKAVRGTLQARPAEAAVQASVVHGLGGSARPSSPSSTPTGTRPTTTWCGGCRPNSRWRSPGGWQRWPCGWACRSFATRKHSSACCGTSWAGASGGC
jgi:hypothetical protein